MKRAFYLFVLAVLSLACNRMETNTAASVNVVDGGFTYSTVTLDNQIKEKLETGAFDAGIKLLQELYSGENICFSPISLSIDLSLLASGAAGETRSEICSFLGIQETEIDALNSWYRELRSVLSTSEQATVNISNSVWVNSNFAIYSNYLKNSENCYDAELFSFETTDENLKDKFNLWCKKATEGLIVNLLEDNPSFSDLMIANALYFKSGWLSKFEKDTQKAPFLTFEGSTISVDMMKGNFQSIPYFQNDQFSMLEMPFRDARYVMDVLLPAEDIDIREFVRTLGSQNFKTAVENLQEKHVLANIPKYTIETKIRLENVLRECGLALSLSPKADYSGISEQPIFISRVLQGSKILVNQDGAEAASTSVIISGELDGAPTPYVEFTADRPFVYFLRERTSNIVLFCGVFAQ